MLRLRYKNKYIKYSFINSSLQNTCSFKNVYRNKPHSVICSVCGVHSVRSVVHDVLAIGDHTPPPERGYRAENRPVLKKVVITRTDLLCTRIYTTEPTSFLCEDAQPSRTADLFRDSVN